MWIRRTILLLLGLTSGPALAAQQLEIRFIDVGQGDAVLIRSGPHAVLIDAGLPDGGILPALRALQVDSLDLFIASHNHGDHIGGAAALLRSIPVGEYIQNDAPLGTPNQRRVDSAILERAVRRVRAPRQILLWGDVRLDIMPPPPGVDSAQNNHSMVVLVQRGRFRALLTGDSEGSEIEALMAQDSIPPVDLLKAPHHGGDPDPPVAEWLRRLHPGVVVASVAAGNFTEAGRQAYGGPGRRLFSTDHDGDVVVSVDAAGAYTVETGPHRAH
jgi:beta-lactamase superfamily II metal-dependent hydrolase